MIEWTDTSPDVDVASPEYHRLLGYPPGHVVDGRAAELARSARDWYLAYGRPWVYAREVQRLEWAAGRVRLDDQWFSAGRLARLLADSGADRAVLVAVSAGDALEEEAARRWREEKPDEYFFLEIFGSALVEHLVMRAGARLCEWADTAGLAVLPHDSPGYSEWDVVEQPPLLSLIRRGASEPLPGPLDALESGALCPKKALLAVFGLTRHVDRVQRLTSLVPCQSCALAGCRYRRAPFGATTGIRELPPAAPRAEREVPDAESPLDLAAPYRVHLRALRRWAAERLTLTADDARQVVAVFRYDGTTCTNMGRPLAFVYEVTLGARQDGFPIRALRCRPAPGDAGYQAMCRYLKDPVGLMQVIADERPPVTDLRLDEARAWQPQTSPAGCYCDPAGREHKWGLVLETIHFALAERERAAGGDGTSR